MLTIAMTMPQINRSNAPTTGKLIYKLTEGPTANPRWLVAFDDEGYRDEELYEHSFVKAGSDEAAMATSPKRDSPSPTEMNNKNTSRHRSSKTTTSSRNSSSGSLGSVSDQDGAGSEDRKMRNKKTVTFSEGSPVPSVPSDSSSPATHAVNKVVKQSKVSAREERSRRRQAMIHQEAQLSGVVGVKRVRSHSSSSHHKGSNKKARANEVTDDEDDEVVKIVMKTGTLFLYRGLHRRAEFVRKF